ncbi:MAG: AMP-binding protein [Kofleriaceae bacterium]
MKLSIRAAAAEHGERAAIITRERTWTFAECAATIVDEDHVVAEPSVATILAIYSALEAQRPLALIHAKQPAEARAEQQRAFAAAEVPTDTAFVLFTSGTTGTSRGVVLSRAAIVAAAAASEARFGWRDDDRWLLALPMAHAGGLSIVVRCLIARKPVVLHEGDFDPARVAELIAIAHTTLASLVPAQLTELVGMPHALLRAVVLGGAAAMPALVDAAVAAGWPVYPSYGLTETFGQIATATRPGGPLVVLPGVTISTADTLTIRAPQLATSYLGGPAIAPELVTSDLGELDDDGTLRVLGRRDDLINTGGEKVHPLDVERVLTTTPGVRAACAFGVADERFGRVVAAVIVGDERFDRASALEHWRHALPSYARPRWLARVDNLPLLPSGKPDRRAIAALPIEVVAYRSW